MTLHYAPAVRRQTLSDVLRRTALRLPAKTAIVCGGTRWTYAEFDALVTRVAAGLHALGVCEGDKVAVLASNDALAFASVFGISRAGAVWCPINPRNGAAENREVLDGAMRDWCAARTQEEVLAQMSDADAAAGPIMTMEDIANDPHYAARNAIINVDGTPMQGIIAKLSETPGAVRWRGRPRNADGEHIRRHGWD